jgi:hypothetical protein
MTANLYDELTQLRAAIDCAIRERDNPKNSIATRAAELN